MPISESFKLIDKKVWDEYSTLVRANEARYVEQDKEIVFNAVNAQKDVSKTVRTVFDKIGEDLSDFYNTELNSDDVLSKNNELISDFYSFNAISENKKKKSRMQK